MVVAAFRCLACSDPIMEYGYCRGCVEDGPGGYKQCPGCNAWTVPDEDYEHVCFACYEKLAVTCNGCAALMLPDDSPVPDLCHVCAGTLVRDDSFTLGLESR